MPTHEPTTPLLLALAGPTSSGKTTIATALSLIFAPPPLHTHRDLGTNPLTIIHADDFYRPDSQIPTRADGTQDWDCPEALDLTRLHTVLCTVRDGGEIPRDLVRQGGLEDGEPSGGAGAKDNSKSEGTTTEEVKAEHDGVHGVQNSPISAEKLTALRHKLSLWPANAKERRIVLIEGILLFSPVPPLSTLTPIFNVRILLRTTRDAAKRRREARAGYVTLEGYWQDPPAYFDEVVWPGFVRAYSGLFLEGDVEGSPDEDEVQKLGIEIGPLLGDEAQREGKERGGIELERLLDWIVDLLEKTLVSPREAI